MPKRPIDLGMTLPEAVAAPRATQRNTTAVQAEPAFQTAELIKLGHVFAPNPEIGAATGVEFLPNGQVVAAAVQRRSSNRRNRRQDWFGVAQVDQRGHGADTGAGDGGLQRRTVRHFTCSPGAEHPAASQGHLRAAGALMWPIAGAPDGSFYSYNQPNLPDQVSARTRPSAVHNQGRSGHRADLPAASDGESGCCPKPIPFGGMGEPVNQNGFSDHFPITNQSHRRRLGPRLNVDQAARRSGPHEPHKTRFRHW
jgi:hypothetical protein